MTVIVDNAEFFGHLRAYHARLVEEYGQKGPVGEQVAHLYDAYFASLVKRVEARGALPLMKQDVTIVQRAAMQRQEPSIFGEHLDQVAHEALMRQMEQVEQGPYAMFLKQRGLYENDVHGTHYGEFGDYMQRADEMQEAYRAQGGSVTDVMAFETYMKMALMGRAASGVGMLFDQLCFEQPREQGRGTQGR